MKGIIYYYYKSTSKPLYSTVGVMLVYIILMAALIGSGDNAGGNRINDLILLAIPMWFVPLSVSTVTGASTLKEDTTIKTILTAPFSQSRVLLAKFIYVGAVVVVISAAVLGLCTILSAFVFNTELSANLNNTAAALGISLILMAVEVPLFHLFNKRTVNTVLLGIAISVISLIFILCMFCDMGDIVGFAGEAIELLKKISNNPVFVVLAGLCLNVLSYFLFSKVRRDIS